MRSGYWRNGLVYLLILAAIVLLLWQIMGRSSAPEKLSITQLAQLIKEGNVQQITTAEEKIEVTPEMVEAGVIALEHYRESYCDDAVVKVVYISMRRLEDAANGAE